MFHSTIHRLRIFQCVIDAGSFSAASKKLNITQPSISAHIQALEQELGQKLFIRNPGRKATLTEAGELLYSYTLDITSRTDQFESYIKQSQGIEKKVSVAVQRSIANHLLPNHLASFHRTHPDFEIIMYSQTQDTVINHVLERKADLGLIMTLQSVEGLYSEILAYQNLELVVGPSHELADRSFIDPAELKRYSFIGPVKTSKHAQVIDLALRRLGINEYNTYLQLEDSKTIVEIAKSGIGIATLPGFSISKELETGELISLPLNQEKTAIEIRLLYNPDMKMSDDARLFMVHLRRTIGNK